MSTSQSNDTTDLYPVAFTRDGGETWFEVGSSKSYTPTADDIGHILKFECVVADVETKIVVGSPSLLSTSLVITAPPNPRSLLSIDGMTFSVLSYNILSDSNATNGQYSYCPSWALSWAYRRQNLLREIVGYSADIVCLQEVQSDHFEEFFAPELDKHGYEAVFKMKNREVFGGNINNIDGCATFYRRDRFSRVKKYEIEFNKAAENQADSFPSSEKKNAINRLITGNIALIVVLKAKLCNQGIDISGKRQLVCVVNTHLQVHPELKDVKLWQVHTLLKGLEKVTERVDMSMLVCGDFNSVPGSAPHTLLASGKVDSLHPDLSVDPLGILRNMDKLTHQLPLVSAYSSYAARTGVGLEERRKIDLATDEPLFTIFTRGFIGTHDYIFYSADNLTVESLMELLDEDSLRKDTALPSPEWSSNHIALLAEFRIKPRTRRLQ